MGTPPSKPMYSAPPLSRPFAHHPKKCLLRQSLLLHSSTKHSAHALQTLIWRQDWQKVLIRLTLYPHEAQTPFDISVYNMCLQVYPLHLICALDPPAVVVHLCCRCFPDAPAMAVRVRNAGRQVLIKHASAWRRTFRAWRLRRRGAFPVDADELSHASVEQRQLLLPFVEDAPREWSAAESSCSSSSNSDNGNDDDASSKSSLSSNHSFSATDNVILQLSNSGGLKCMTPLSALDTTDETESTSAATAKSSIYRVKWDLKPLWKQVAQHGMLLPLHVACLFQANPAAIESLVQMYPLAGLSDILGMLPIHWVAAGWTLPTLQPPPPSPVPPEPKPGPLSTLHVLRRALPECLQIRSGNHGMLAEDYIQECMEESEYKQLCLKVLSEGIDYMMEYGSFVSGDQTLVFCDTDKTDETSSYPSLRLFAGLSGLILEEDWTKAIAVVEEDPASARKWYYGVNSETVGTTVWKRLPIHLACANGAPLGLIDLLLTVFPESALVEDPHDGSLPLHIACRAAAALPVVRRLVHECPEAVLAVDGGGRAPLHVAVTCGAPYVVVEYLVMQDLDSVVALDCNGRTPMDYAMDQDSEAGPLVDFFTMILVKLDRS